MGLGFNNKKKLKNFNSNSTKSVFTKSDVEKALKKSNLGKVPKGSNGITGQVGKKVKAVNTKTDDIDDIFNPKV